MNNIEFVFKYLNDKLSKLNIPVLLFRFLLLSTYIEYLFPEARYCFRPICISLYFITIYNAIFFKQLRISYPKFHEILIIIIFVSCFISTILNHDFRGVETYNKDILYALFVFISLRLLLLRINIYNIINEIKITGFCGCLISLIAYFIFFGEINEYNIGCFEGYRLTGFMGKDPNYAMSNIVLFTSLGLANKKYKLGLYFALFCFVLSMSRGALLAAFVAFVASNVLADNKIQKFKDNLKFSLKLLIVLLVLIMIGSSFYNMDIVVNRFGLESILRGAGRSSIWKWAIESIADNYAYGIGFGNTRFYNKKYHDIAYVCHNSYFDFYVEGGIFVGFLYVVFNIWLFFRIICLREILKIYGLNINFLIISTIMFNIMFCFLSNGIFRPSYIIYLTIIERLIKIRVYDHELS